MSESPPNVPFDLRVEPWIPVLDQSGDAREVSLTQLFAEAQHLRGISTAFGPERVALTRILIATLASAITPPRGLADALRMLDGHQAILPLVHDYLDERADVFDLFHPVRPFMQLAPLPDTKETTVAALVLGWSSGNNVTLTDHHVDARPPALTPAEAARALLTTLLYQPGGGVAKPFNRTDSPGTKPLMTMLDTGNLWDTLVANTPTEIDASARPVAWDADERRALKEGTTPEGVLDHLTWQSRRIRLIRDHDGLVRRCTINQHLKLSDGAVLRDPFVPTRTTDDGDELIVRLNSNRRLWRSVDTVIAGLGRRRAVAETGTQLLARAGRPHPDLIVVGLQVDQAKIGDAQSATLPVSESLLRDEERIALVRMAIMEAGQGEFAITRAFERYVGELREVSGKLPRALADEARALASPYRERYWGTLSARFPLFMAQLAGVEEPPTPETPPASRWRELVGQVALHTVSPLTQQPGPRGHDHAASRAVGVARYELISNNLLAPPSRTKEAV